MPAAYSGREAFMTESDFFEGVLENQTNVQLLKRLQSIGLPDCYLTAGCLFQSFWNVRSGKDSQWGIKDYDVFYFDNDTTWSAENDVIKTVSEMISDLGVNVEVRNQARVHLWYPNRFGRSYPQLKSACDGIDRYLISCTCIGINAATGDLYAPNGFQDLEGGFLRMNPRNPQPDHFREKAQSYRSRWPWLTVVE
jgi:uncharacterized protein